MSGEAEAALGLAVEALLERDADKARQVIRGDRVIDRMEVEIEEQCINLLALQQPMARDLRMLTSALKIANDLERVGDHAVNIAQSAERLAEPARHRAGARDRRDGAARRATCSPTPSRRSSGATPQAGREVCRRDDKVDALHRSVFRILLTHMMEDPHTIGAGMELFLVSRNLERVADLATNIGEDVVFLVEGKSIKHHAEDRRRRGAGRPGSPEAGEAARARRARAPRRHRRRLQLDPAPDRRVRPRRRPGRRSTRSRTSPAWPRGWRPPGGSTPPRWSAPWRRCARMADVCRRRGATRIAAVATAAVREAKNGDEFVRRVRDELGLPLRDHRRPSTRPQLSWRSVAPPLPARRHQAPSSPTSAAAASS